MSGHSVTVAVDSHGMGGVVVDGLTIPSTRIVRTEAEAGQVPRVYIEVIATSQTVQLEGAEAYYDVSLAGTNLRATGSSLKEALENLAQSVKAV